MRRVRSHREYELRRLSDDSLVAVAQADWVYIDAATLFPCRIPAEAEEAFRPNGCCALDNVSPPEETQSVDGRRFVYHHRVKSYELDNLHHVNKIT
jgi:acyl-CoA thioesterase FadM